MKGMKFFMDKKRQIRKPKQLRAINSKEKIVDASYKLFCEKGYYKTNSIEIAKFAGVSIGCFYSYFKDKDAVFLQILDMYNNNSFEILNIQSDISDIYKKDKKKWLFLIIDNLIKAHEYSKNLNRELIVMYNSNSEIASIIDKHNEKMRRVSMDHFKDYVSDIKVADKEAAGIIAFDLINAIVDEIVFGRNTIDSERLLKAGIDALYKYLFI